MKHYTIIAKDDETGKEVTYTFTSLTEYRAKLDEINAGYFTLEENTLTTLVVARLKDLFSE